MAIRLESTAKLIAVGLGAGSVARSQHRWAVLLGRVILLDLGSTNIGTVPETYVGFFAAAMIVGLGLVLLVTVGRDRNPTHSG